MSARGGDQRPKNLRIKTGVVKRLAKEKAMYEKEVVDQEAKIEKMKADKKDEYDIKKQGEVLQESRCMIPDCQQRLKTAYDDLSALLGECSDLKDSDEYKGAEDILQQVTV